MRGNVITFNLRDTLVPSGPAASNATMIDFVVERLRRDEAKADKERRILDALTMIAGLQAQV